MPGLEENPKSTQVLRDSDPEEQHPAPTPAPQEETQPTRTLTQTDMLNNRLLKSFLNRMNTGDIDIANKFTNPPETTQATSDFDD